MKATRLKDADNRGSTLILVVICASFIMILSSVVLSLTVTNRQMKRVDYNAKDNFYSAEIALDEIRVGLEEYVAEALENSYLKVLEHFASYSEEEKSDTMRNVFLDNMEAYLESEPGYYKISLLENMLSNSIGFNVTSGDNRLIRIKNSIRLKNIKVSYEDEDAYLTTVSTDILIHTPQSTFTSYFVTPAFAGYSLIADKGIKLDGTGLANGAKVKGNIYSGDNGILLNNSKLNIGEADYIVTRGDIEVEHNSVLNIKDQPSLWLKNISVNSHTIEEFELSIEGRCYVADDLTINGDKSKVKIQGEYYGYNYESCGDREIVPLTAAASSAIVINGRSAGLEFSNMDALMIGGRAFLSPEYGGDSRGIYTGESITVKEMQMAYLVPEEFLWCGSNPVTQEEYMAKPVDVAEVDYRRSSSFPINLEDYTDGFMNLHYIIHGEQYKYYYLKFQSEAKANEYMQKYFEIFSSGSEELINIDEHMGINVESIILDNSACNIFLTAGNLLTYTSGRANLINNSVAYGNPSLNAMEQLANLLAKRYDSMKSVLEPVSTRAAYDKNSVFNSIIDMDKLKLAPFKSAYAIELNGESYHVHIINNPASSYNISDIPSSERKGIVIAMGSISIDGDYQGLIIAGEELELKALVNVNASKDMVEGILGMGNPDINRYFRAYNNIITPEVGDASSSISIKDLIVFENWKKNK